MKLKQYLTLGIGVAVGFGVSVVGVSYASKNITRSVKLITSEQAKSIMLNKVPGANFIEFSYDGDDMKPKYDGTLIKGDNEYEIDVDAKTGQITKCEKEVIAISNNSTNSNTANNTTTNTQQNTVASNNTNVTTTNNSNATTNNANTTTVTNNSSNSKATTSSSSYIGSAKAKSIMLNKVPGATVKSFSFDGDGTPEYDGELIKDGYEYDISVDARTGAIREFSKERIDGYEDRYDDDRYDNDYDDDDRYDD